MMNIHDFSDFIEWNQKLKDFLVLFDLKAIKLENWIIDMSLTYIWTVGLSLHHTDALVWKKNTHAQLVAEILSIMVEKVASIINSMLTCTNIVASLIHVTGFAS